MPRKLRIQYPGAIYHVMSRGDRRDKIFLDDVERLLGEHGIGADDAAGRQQFEERMAWRRGAEEDEQSLAPIRRGWCLGSVTGGLKLV